MLLARDENDNLIIYENHQRRPHLNNNDHNIFIEVFSGIFKTLDKANTVKYFDFLSVLIFGNKLYTLSLKVGIY